MDRDLIELMTNQEQLSSIAEQIRASGSTEPALMLTLAAALAKLALLEGKMSGKTETHSFIDQTNDCDLPF